MSFFNLFRVAHRAKLRKIDSNKGEQNMGMQLRIETITPDMAAEILENHNNHNRPLNRERVRLYTRELQEGRWKQTHQGIALAEDGTLLDGQHRLAAIRESGIPVAMPVGYGLDADAQRTMDQGRGRTLGDTLTAEGMPKGKRVGAIARTILTLTKGIKHPSTTEGYGFAYEHLDVLERYATLSDRYSAAVAAAFAHAELKGLNGVRQAADRLADLLWTDEGDPMRALKKALDSMKGEGTGAKSMAVRFWTTYNTLRAVDAGRPLTVAKRLSTCPAN
jgi:hypothetical protein